MEIIKEINYDWVWKCGLILLIIGTGLLLVGILTDHTVWSTMGIPLLALGVVAFPLGIAQLKNSHTFRVKLTNTYTVQELSEQCDYIAYEPDYGTWLVRFKNGKNDEK